MQMTKASGRVFRDAGADLLHHLEVDVEQIVAAHARLSRHAGGDDHHVGAPIACVALAPDELGVEAFDRRGLGDIQRLALRHALRHVEQDDVAEFLQAGEKGERAADLPGPMRAIFLRAMDEGSLRAVGGA